jgi:hypothetical protein
MKARHFVPFKTPIHVSLGRWRYAGSIMGTLIYAGIILAALVVIGIILTRLYRRATKDVA